MNKPTAPEARPAGKPIPGPTARAATAKLAGAAAQRKRAEGLPTYFALDFGATALNFIGVLVGLIGAFVFVTAEDDRLVGLAIVGGGIHLLVFGPMLRGLHIIARNTANLNRLHQPKARSNGN